MDVLDIARWQFGITTVYHFLMVPLTIGLGLLVAVIQTMWDRTDKPEYLRMTKFWGKLFLINFIMGVATGIVQEFQFGMAWSEYSRFVGDVFGAPLAMEALLAFFVESTFLGLWIFGWDRIPKQVHLAASGPRSSARSSPPTSSSWPTAGCSTRSASRWTATAAPCMTEHRRGLHQQHRPRRRSATRLRRPAVAGALLSGIGLWHRRHGGQLADGSSTRRTSTTGVWRRSLRLGRLVVAGRLPRRHRSPATGRASSCSSSSP